MQKKAKRRLTDIDFSHTGAHLALCSKEQGAANGYQHALVIKSSANFSEEFIEKMQSVKVTMKLPEFLEKFFNVYGYNAEVLARMMGYVPEEKEEEYDDNWYENLIQEKLDSFEIMKSMYLSNSVSNVISSLTEDQYFKLVTDQVALEKCFSEIEANKSTEEVQKDKEEIVEETFKSGDYVTYGDSSLAKVIKSENDKLLINIYDTVTKSKTSTYMLLDKSKLSKITPVVVEKTSKTNHKEKLMEDEIVAGVELVEKSVVVELEKAASEQKVALEKALETIAKFEADKKETIRKSRVAALTEVVKDESKVAILYKALGLIEDEAVYAEILEVVKGLVKAVDTSEMFVEKGASVSADKPEHKVGTILKAKLEAKYNKNSK